MKKIISVIMAVILVTISMHGCSSSKTMKIGLMGTFSGPTRGMSESGKRGFYIAVDEINSNGGIKGRQLEVVEKNDLNDSEIALEITEAFHDENIDIVVGPFSSTIMTSIYDYINENKMLFISPVVNAMTFHGKDDYLILMNSDAATQSNLIYDMATKNGNTDFIFAYDSSNKAFSNALLDSLKSKTDDQGGSVSVEIEFNGSSSSVGQTVLEELNSYDYKNKCLFLVATGAVSSVIISEMRLNGIDIDIYTSAWTNSQDFFEIGGKFIEGTYMISPVDYMGTQKRFTEFRERYLNLYGSEPTMGSVFAYETMITIEDALSSTNSVKPNILKSKILEIGSVTGLQNNYEINEFGDANREYFPMIVINGEMIRLD